jgi:hypothetical protein
MKTIKIKFKDQAGFYYCTWSFEKTEDLWRKICKEEREYKSKFQQFITD